MQTMDLHEQIISLTELGHKILSKITIELFQVVEDLGEKKR
jgi:hypothetical protein